MLRRLHAWAGLALACLIVVVAVTGVALSLQPAIDRLSLPPIARGVSVATLAAGVEARHKQVDALRVRGDGAVTVTFDDGQGKRTEYVDPATGAGLGAYTASPAFRWLADLHRSLFLGDGGRIAVALAALGLLGVSLTGTWMLGRSLGGARALLRPIRGGAARRWHGELGRLALAGLVVSSLTGGFLAATTLGLLPMPETAAPSVAASGGARAPISGLAGLASVEVADLDRLSFPAPDDASEAFDLVSAQGEALVDPSTGQVLSFAPASVLERITRWAYLLHTGRVSWAFALLLGLSTAAAPVLGLTGVVIWLRRAARPKAAVVADADTVVLVGSEGGSTWGFARTLQSGLAAAGHRVQLAAMDDVESVSPAAERMLVLAATYGDGDAPASARRFLEKLGRWERRMPVAVLGFGDRSFPSFCGYAHKVAEAFAAHGCPTLMSLKRIDRQSAQEFAQWGRDLGAALGCELKLEHVAERPKTSALELTGRESYGEAVGAPVAILRFAGAGRTGLPAFEAGDLVGVFAPGSAMPRFYSLASSRRDGVLEICVRLQPGGVCSTYLHGLQPGDRIEAFVRENPGFRPAAGKAPLILIGAGAGIAPLAGFVRANEAGRPVHLYWGGRSPASDFLYEHELAASLAANRLTRLRTAFSRHPAGAAYVQDRLADDAHGLRDLIREGAQILVCGGREMARAVAEKLDAVVRPLGLDLATLKAQGRYLEDVY